MDLFLSFLTVEVVRSHDHLGCCNGWTLLENNGLNLIISGGIIHGVEYLDSLRFKTKLSNHYNNFVNPFFMFEILTEKGQSFFIEYYKDDINKIVTDNKNKAKQFEKQLNEQKKLCVAIDKEIKTMRFLAEKDICPFCKKNKKYTDLMCCEECASD